MMAATTVAQPPPMFNSNASSNSSKAWPAPPMMPPAVSRPGMKPTNPSQIGQPIGSLGNRFHSNPLSLGNQGIGSRNFPGMRLKVRR